MQLYWVSASHTGHYAKLTSLGLYVMHARAVRSVRPVESTGLQETEVLINEEVAGLLPNLISR